MNQNKIKVIQTRLKNRGKRFTLDQIRKHIIVSNYADVEPTENLISKIVDELSGSSEIVPASTNDELSHTQKQTLIQQVASTLEVSLSVEEVQSISQKMDWVLSDRASLKDRIKSAIVAWVDYQVDQDLQQTDEMMQEVEQYLVTRLQEANQHFNSKATAFSGRIEEARDKFRTTEAKILNLFKVPS
ncbi:hypothetical protein [Nostoc punctiforme]|uniref:Uncharacterized protein n=2 Tax=Nostoc punctiforme TaxID=272131 RepID=B2ITE4_NOSP7|nr:hypothetical protein [Nostoc punctiforme]ACC81175.1 hypothetical protein Npun_R2621 [Nostoc punctiforme PCC 73102]RCJ41122.1 hypothetical protein A6769_38880 [Nostoc punctiforme NIES-2108]